jgi:uncharacterized Fe-S cluster protein YjdI
MARDRLQVYEGKEVRVTFDPAICIHSRVCLRTLPAVFDVSKKRWVQPANATGKEVMDAVAKCPSGALQAHYVTSVHPVVAKPTDGAT